MYTRAAGKGTYPSRWLSDVQSTAEESQNSMNNRANIMYFIEHLCDMAQRENHLNFVRMVQKDIFQIVDAVAPSDGAGAANVKVVRRVGLHLQPLSRPSADGALGFARSSTEIGLPT